MKMVCWVAVLVSIGVLTCSSSCEAQSCRPSPLWLYLYPEDIAFFLPGVEDPIVLVNNGEPLESLLNPIFAVQSVYLFDSVVELPLIWCVQNNEEFKDIRYSLDIMSSDLAVVDHPNVTIPLEGTVTTTPYRFRLLFRCLPASTSSTTPMSFAINSSSLTGEEFCPIHFYFAKQCAEGEGTPDELPTELDVLGIRDGYINDSNFNIKLTAPPVTVVKNIQNTTLPNILKGVFIPLCIIILLTIVAMTMAWVVWYRRSRKKIMEFHPEAVSQAYQDLYVLRKNYRDYEKEFPPGQLKIMRVLGEGAFGVVSQGQAEGIVKGETLTDVAIKQLHPGSTEVDDFFREVDFMSNLDHINIVKLLGVCSLEEPFSMIFEYMDLGDLRTFLRDAIGLGKDAEEEEGGGEDDDNDDNEEPLLTSKELLVLIEQVAMGMSYISSKHLVHRDLAARNCLVSTGLVVKIADFGMSRNMDTSDYYRVKGSALLPVRWMPPESILYGKFTVESDIWAYGILMWEVFTLGQQPYAGLENDEVISRIRDGKHPAPPPDCPAHQLMLQCWNKNPKKRPSFDECKRKIEELMKLEDE